MKTIALLLFSCGICFAFPVDQDWDHLSCGSVDGSKAQEFVDYYRQRIQSAQGYLDRCGSGPGGGDCVVYVVGKGYTPSTASAACEGIGFGNFDCFKYVLNEGYTPSTANLTCRQVISGTCVQELMAKGYSPATAGETCAGLNDYGSKCVSFVVGKGYTPSTAGSSCSKCSRQDQLNCITNLINQGYTPVTAASSCT